MAYMAFIAAILIFIIGVLFTIFPVKLVAQQNKKQIAQGLFPMSEEEIALTIKKIRKLGIRSAFCGVAMALIVMLLQLL